MACCTLASAGVYLAPSYLVLSVTIFVVRDLRQEKSLVTKTCANHSSRAHSSVYFLTI